MAAISTFLKWRTFTHSAILFRNAFVALPELSLLSLLFVVGVKWDDCVKSCGVYKIGGY
jgi:hypothetical protein